MTPSPSLNANSSFESIRKKAKKLHRQFAAADTDALARVYAQLPAPNIPLTLRDAQFVLAREYGFAGWQDLRTAVLRRQGTGIEWAAAEAERAIHANDAARLAQLTRDYPDLLTWRGDSGESLLQFATGSFGDSGDPYREQTFTRLACAEFLLDSGAVADASIWEGAIRSRAAGVLDLLARKGALPLALDTLAALGPPQALRESLAASPADAAALNRAFLIACMFNQREAAALLLSRLLELDPALADRVEKWRGRTAFIAYLADHARDCAGSLSRAIGPWQTLVMNELRAAIDEDNFAAFTRWLGEDPDLLTASQAALQADLIEHAVLKNRAPFIAHLIDLAPHEALRRTPTSALEFALEYGHAHLIPLLTSVWPLPGDLAHAAGVGDFSRVKTWFDAAGHPQPGSLAQHYPANNPAVLRNLHWTPPNVQHILDVALAWACLNGHFEIATFLLAHGANVNTAWSTHEPAGILHECAMRGNYEAAQFLIDRGIDMTRRDYRWDATAEGWARHAAKDQNMADFLARAASARKTGS